LSPQDNASEVVSSNVSIGNQGWAGLENFCREVDHKCNHIYYVKHFLCMRLWGVHNGVAEESKVLGCDDVSSN
jgi:hypothetical protein